MPHKAGKDFFAQKKEWSRRKDLVLNHYLKPYLAKVGTMRKPILVVDGFAGPGRFGDGEAGSPVLICQQVEEARNRGTNAQVKCVESDPELFESLQKELKVFPFSSAVNAKFLSVVPEIEKFAPTHTVFLYLDPFTVEGIEWDVLDKIFKHLHVSRSSIEVLLNLNVPSFVRRGLAALQVKVERPEEEEEGNEGSTSKEKLDSIVGGSWWIPILKASANYASMIDQITDGFCERLRLRFQEVCRHSVKEKHGHSIPKYVLVFGSRHPDALELMNDAMVKSREMFATSAAPAEPTLFEMRPEDVVPDEKKLPTIVLQHAANKIARQQLVLAVMRAAFCDFSAATINKCIKQLIASGKLASETGNARINDNTFLWRV